MASYLMLCVHLVSQSSFQLFNVFCLRPSLSTKYSKPRDLFKEKTGIDGRIKGGFLHPAEEDSIILKRAHTGTSAILRV
jgi:hypothetical protein